MITEKIVINAPAETIFEAIRKQRSDATKKRKLQSYDGKVAVIEEELEGVPVYGKVQCVWQETEQPFERIDFKMVRSSKFKESYGAWVLKPDADGKSTTLELQAHMDAGIMIPFASEITKASTSKDSKARLQEVKRIAEEMARQGST